MTNNHEEVPKIEGDISIPLFCSKKSIACTDFKLLKLEYTLHLKATQISYFKLYNTNQGWQLPQAPGNAQSPLNYSLLPLLRGNGVTHIRAMVKPLCES